MKPIKLTIDEPRDYIAAGKVLNEIKPYLDDLEAGKDLPPVVLVAIEADVYEVTIKNQEKQLKINIGTKQTFDEIYDRINKIVEEENNEQTE